MKARLAAALVLVATALPVPARAHGASRGLHVHVTPEEAPAGAVVSIAVDASAPLTRLTIGFVGEEPKLIRPKQPRKRVELKLAVPRKASGRTAGIQAEALTPDGRTLRAAALVLLKP